MYLSIIDSVFSKLQTIVLDMNIMGDTHYIEKY